MRYVHAENNHRITFADEKDYHRCRLSYLINCTDDVSSDYSFTFFIERELYKSFQFNGAINVDSIEHIDSIGRSAPSAALGQLELGMIPTPSGIPYYYTSTPDGSSYHHSAFAAARAAETRTATIQRQYEELARLYGLQSNPPLSMPSEEFRQQYQGDWTQDGDDETQAALDDFMQMSNNLAADNGWPVTTELDGPPTVNLSDDGLRGFTARANARREEKVKEEDEPKKINKHKSFFETIDID